MDQTLTDYRCRQCGSTSFVRIAIERSTDSLTLVVDDDGEPYNMGTENRETDPYWEVVMCDDCERVVPELSCDPREPNITYPEEVES